MDKNIIEPNTIDSLFSRTSWNTRSNIPKKDVSTKKFDSMYLVLRGDFVISSIEMKSSRVFAIPFFEFAENGSLHYALRLSSSIYFETPNAWTKQKYGMELVKAIAHFLNAFNFNPGGEEYLLDNGMLYFLIENPLIHQKFLNLGFTPIS
jgi:hypothetical protein